MKAIKLILISLLFPALAFAHGGEDHGHDEAPAAQDAVTGQPHIEAATETFEIVGQLQNGELSLLIDRFETNEPVLNGHVEVELNGQKATAKFHADHGDYAVDDQVFIKALTEPGKHGLVFTVTAGNDMDLLETTLSVGDNAPITPEGHKPAVSLSTAAMVGAVLALVLAVIAVALSRRKSSSGN